jgi:hypothetical protein
MAGCAQLDADKAPTASAGYSSVLGAVLIGVKSGRAATPAVGERLTVAGAGLLAGRVRIDRRKGPLALKRALKSTPAGHPFGRARRVSPPGRGPVSRIGGRARTTSAPGGLRGSAGRDRQGLRRDRATAKAIAPPRLRLVPLLAAMAIPAVLY